MSTITFKPGDTFALVGQIDDDGVPQDLTGYTIEADVLQATAEGAPGAKLTDLTVVVTAPLQGGFTLRHLSTDSWPVNATLLTDVRLTAPDGTRTRFPTLRILTVPGVTT